MSSDDVGNFGELAFSRRVGVFFAVAIALGVAPLFLAELNVLAHQSMYQFFPFSFAFVAWMGVVRWRGAAGTVGSRRSAPWHAETLCVLAALGALTLHAGLFGPWLGGFAGLMTLAAGGLVLQRFRRLQVWDLWLILLISTRLPLELDRRLASGLQTLSSRMSSLVLDALGVLHVLRGNVVSLADRDLFVDEACSGVISVMAVIACAAMLAVWHNRPLIHSALMVSVGVGCAMLMNVVRIVAIAAALEWYGRDWTTGWPHELLSLTTFLATFVALLALDYALLGVAAKTPEAETERMPRGALGLARAWNWLVTLHPFRAPDVDDDEEDLLAAATLNSVEPRSLPRWRFAVLASLAVLLGVYHSVALYAHYVSATGDVDAVVERMMKLDQSVVAAAVAPWVIEEAELVERDAIAELGRFSQVYQLRLPANGAAATLSIDFPFYRRWHDVCGCYVNSGWKQERYDVTRDRGPDDARPCEFIEAAFANVEGATGWLRFANLNQDGRLIAPPRDWGDWGYLANTFIMKVNHGRQVSLNPQKVFQVQVWRQGLAAPDAAEETALRQLFFSAFDAVSGELARLAGGGPLAAPAATDP